MQKIFRADDGTVTHIRFETALRVQARFIEKPIRGG
jgi:hypothetical protein